MKTYSCKRYFNQKNIHWYTITWNRKFEIESVAYKTHLKCKTHAVPNRRSRERSAKLPSPDRLSVLTSGTNEIIATDDYGVDCSPFYCSCTIILIIFEYQWINREICKYPFHLCYALWSMFSTVMPKLVSRRDALGKLLT